MMENSRARPSFSSASRSGLAVGLDVLFSFLDVEGFAAKRRPRRKNLLASIGLATAEIAWELDLLSCLITTTWSTGRCQGARSYRLAAVDPQVCRIGWMRCRTTGFQRLNIWGSYNFLMCRYGDKHQKMFLQFGMFFPSRLAYWCILCQRLRKALHQCLFLIFRDYTNTSTWLYTIVVNRAWSLKAIPKASRWTIRSYSIKRSARRSTCGWLRSVSFFPLLVKLRALQRFVSVLC